MAPFDRPYTTFFWSIVNIALSCTVFSVIWHWVISYLEICFIGHSRSFKLVLFERLGAVFYSSSIVTMAVSCIICEIKRDIGRKSWFFHTPLYSTLPLWGLPSEYCHPVCCGKTRIMGLLDGKKNFEDICNCLDSIPACDGQTVGRMDILQRHSPRYAYASRGKKNRMRRRRSRASFPRIDKN